MEYHVTAPSYRSTLARYLRPQAGRVGVLSAALLASIGLQILVPLILRRFIDSALAGAAVGGLMGAGVIYLLAGVANQLLSAGAAYLGADVGWTATNALREDLTDHLLGLDMGYHNDTTPGEMIERIDGDVTAVSNFLSRFLVRLLGSGLLLLGVLVVSWLTDWRMGAAISVYVAGVLTLIVRMRRLAVAASEEEREVSAWLYGFIEERLAGIDDIRANGAGRFVMLRFVGVMRDFFHRTVAAWRKRTVFWVASNIAFWSGDAIALAMGVWLVVRGEVTIGTAYLIVQYVQLVRTPIEQVAQEFQELQKAAGGIVRIDHLRSLESALDESGRAALPDGALSVTFENVGFAYDDHPVLRDVSFELAEGRVLGLLGRTGGGKTTITRLISRLYDPTSGSIRMAGLELHSISPVSLRHRVGVVTQDVQLFRATVRENLTFFDQNTSDDEIFGILEQAGLGEWIGALGLDTELGAAGAGLSAGESQLLAFARVFLQEPGLVILDEPSSRLDPATESVLALATERLFEGRTVVIVAHRLDTVQRADEIMVVEEGRIAEHGLRADLAADAGSRYARLLAAGEQNTMLERGARWQGARMTEKNR
jgi:ABC-type multidrug transport system fused ATPase/permease subunit